MYLSRVSGPLGLPGTSLSSAAALVIPAPIPPSVQRKNPDFLPSPCPHDLAQLALLLLLLRRCRPTRKIPTIGGSVDPLRALRLNLRP